MTSLLALLISLVSAAWAEAPDLHFAKAGDFKFTVVHSNSLDADQLEIRRGNQLVELRTSIARYEIGRSSEMSPDTLLKVGQDLSNSGSPHVVVYESSSSGRHFVTHVWRLGETAELLGSFDEMAGFERDSKNGRWKVITGDFAFQSWRAGPNFSFIPEVRLVWRPDANRFCVDSTSMRAQAPETKELDQLIADTLKSMGEYDAVDGKIAQMNETLLKLIYSGNAATAEKVFDRTFPGGEDRNQYRIELSEILSRSRYWPELLVAGFAAPQF